MHPGGRCVGLTTLPPSFANCLEIWDPQPTKNSQEMAINFVCFLLGISPASDQVLPTFRNPLSGPSSKPLKMDLTEGSETSEKLNLPHPAFEDGPDRGFQNVGKT
jgi:hypothetical protein